MTTGLRRCTPLAALVTALFMTGACDTTSPAPPVKPPSEEPRTTGPLSSDASSSAPTPAAPRIVGPAPADLRTLDWTKVPAPGEFCGVPGLVRFDANGEARATSTVWGLVRISRSGRHITYGDTDGDHRDEAVVYIGCDDNGATQNTQLAAGYVVYAHVGEKLAAIGSITPQKAGEYSTALAGAEFAPGRIIVHEKWWRPGDAHCCPSGDATTVWTREGNHLTPGAPRITS
ncbi:hypothetical protein AB0N50_11815 [Streptomyces pharetrae]|uniref:hypothetical protein n=1 Tax=Streptomyces pharetrae TaxID=291370 RepID=UPI0034606138